MIEIIEKIFLYSGGGSLALSAALFIGGVTWNHIQSSPVGLPIYQDLPEGNF